MSCAAWRRQTRRFHPPGDVHAADFSHHRRDEALEWWGAGAEGGYRETGELTGWWGEDAGSGAVTSWVGSCACSVRGINGTHCAGEDAWLWVDAAGDAVRCHDGLDGLEEPHDDADHSPPGLLRSAPTSAGASLASASQQQPWTLDAWTLHASSGGVGRCSSRTPVSPAGNSRRVERCGPAGGAGGEWG